MNRAETLQCAIHVYFILVAFKFKDMFDLTIKFEQMKLRIELEIELGDNFISPYDKEERDWLFNHILTKSNLFLHDNEIVGTIGEVKKVVKCEEVK